MTVTRRERIGVYAAFLDDVSTTIHEGLAEVGLTSPHVFFPPRERRRSYCVSSAPKLSAKGCGREKSSTLTSVGEFKESVDGENFARCESP